jgi:methylenetetrahydrofolate--tRNA-(uracil-5-)-methyltransferase
MKELLIIGGGLAGSEAAWQAAIRGMRVVLYEMRPDVHTGAHVSSNLAELVCSNSLGSNLPDRASGVIKNELRRMDSLLLKCAEEAAVPAGGALAVDREVFSQSVTDQIERHSNIRVIREEVQEIPAGPVIIASGPLTSPGLSKSIRKLSGLENLYFYDAIAPIVSLESVDMGIAFRGSRYQRGDQEDGDYINCPMTKEEYDSFNNALVKAERIEIKEFEHGLNSDKKTGAQRHFEGCLPVEVLACRGKKALAYGPMRPVGLEDPRTGQRPFAIVQLRQDDLAGTLYNLVGFQTNLKYSEQQKVFRMIPGLQNADFVRYGQMHRNTFINSPVLLKPTLQFKSRDDLFFAGQIAGVEGYIGNIATGLFAGWNISRLAQHQKPVVFPVTTMLGSLCHYITHAKPEEFQPMKVNFGILPPLEDGRKRNKRERAKAYAYRSKNELETYLISEAF